MKVTNFGGDFPLALAGWSTGITSVNSNVDTIEGLSATNFVQRITANSSNVLLNPIVNFASGSNILLTLDQGPLPAQAYPSNTIRIHSTGGGGGNIITANGSNSLAAVVNLKAGSGIALGVTGQDITITNTGSGGGGTSGGLVFLEAHTASSSSSLDFTTFISSTYDTYKIELVSIVLGTSTADLRVEGGTGGGPTYDTGNNYQWSAVGHTSGNVAYTDAGATGIARIFRDTNISANFGFGTASLTLFDPQSTSLYKTIVGSIYWTTVTVASGPAAVAAHWGVQWYNASAMTALRFIPSSGNIASGTIRIYGISKA